MAFTIKRNDTRPRFRATLTQPDTVDPTVQVPVNLTTATSVKFIMSKDGAVKVTRAAAIITAAAGLVEFAWAGTDTDTAGTFVCEFEVTWNDAAIQTFPSDSYLTITIKDDLG